MQTRIITDTDAWKILESFMKHYFMTEKLVLGVQ